MRFPRSASSLSLNFFSLFISYALVITLFAPFAIRRVKAEPSAQPRLSAPTTPAKEKGGRREGELLVRFREDISEQDRNTLVGSHRGRRARKLRGESRLEKVELQAGQDPQAVAVELRTNPAVERAEPNFLISHDEGVPNDTRLHEQWALRNTGASGGQIGADINAMPAWGTTTGAVTTVIAVIDSGIDFTHPDLRNNQWANSDERDNGRDDDSDGFTDDLHGWDWVANSNAIKDEQGHGTNVAGIIAAEGNNSTGVTGVMWRAGLMSLRVLDNTGTGDVAAAVEAIDYAIAHGAQVINCSWGTDEESLILRDAIERAGRRGVVVVSSAGNQGRDIETAPYYPASFGLPNVVAVASTDQFDQLATWSNRGASHVTVAAPGTDILTTQINGGYRSVTGTSFSAPLVSGIAGLVKTVRPWLSANGTALAIREGARAVTGLTAQVSTAGVASASGALGALHGPGDIPPSGGGNGGNGGNGEDNGGGNGNGHPVTRPSAPGHGSGGHGPGGSFSVDPPHRTQGAPGPNLPNLDELRRQQPRTPRAPTPIQADNPYADCDLSCGGIEPPPGGGSDPYMSSVRTDPRNETGQLGEDLGSQNFNWSQPLVDLKGRAGLDLALSLTYNSLVWTKENSTIRFNADHGFPGAGFRLGFPVLQQRYYDSQSGFWSYLMITPTGGRVELRQVGGSNIYYAADNSYTQLTDNGTNVIVRTTNGTQHTFVPSVHGQMVCTQIKDRNGNYISATYNSLGRPTTMTDTLGRTINFNYTAQNYLSSITQTWNGATHTWATFNFGNLYVQTNFPNLSVQGPQNGSYIPVLTWVGLHDGSRYEFSYTSWGQVYLIKHIAYDNHERAHVRYDLPVNASIPRSDCPRFSNRYEYAENWNNEQEALTSYTVDPGGAWTQMTMPNGKIYKEFFATSGWQKGLTTRAEEWFGGVLKKWTTTAWTQDNTGLSYQNNPRPYDISIYDEAGNRRRIDIIYTSYGLPYEVREYSVDGSGYGGFLRRTYTDYNFSQAYINRHVIGLISTVHVVDETNTLVTKTVYDYDRSGEWLVDTPQTTIQHDPNYNSAYASGRGNLAVIYRFDVTDSNNWAKAIPLTQTGYDTNGSVVFTRDALNHRTNISYQDSFSDGVNRNSFAYPTSVTDPDNYSSYMQYHYNMGAVTRTQDPKGAVVTMEYDAAGRLQWTRSPFNGAWQFRAYPDRGDAIQSQTTIQNGANAYYSIVTFDGAGRVRSTGGDLPGSTGLYHGQFTLYDIMGRPSQRSNPAEMTAWWAPTGDDAAGWVWTYQNYDWNGRPLVTTNPDGTTAENIYGGCGCAGGEVTTSRDERGRRRRLSKDVLGRLSKVEELGWDQTVYSTTTYAYNARDQIKSINQAGLAPRIFAYDGHGRLSSRTTPEQGVTSYSYYADDTTQTVTDARGATTTFGYNNRHLVTSISYGVPAGVGATANVSFGYDEAGNRTSMNDGLGWASYQYNTLSQMTSESRYFNEIGGAYTTSYGYNLVGELTSVSTPWNEVVSYGRDAMGRVTGVTGASGTLTYASGLQYRASGARKRMTYGNGRVMSVGYDSRLRINQWDVSNVMGWEYRYDTPNIHENTNRVAYARNLYDPTLDRSYDYDHVGRMWASHSGQEARGHTGLGSWAPANGPYAQNQSFDVYGNMIQRNGWGTQNSSYPLTTFVSNRMQINPVTGAAMQYDAAGNLTSDGTESFTYDATGQQTYASSTNLSQYYDGDGLRLKKIEYGATSFYIRSSVLGNQVLGELYSGSWWRLYTYLGREVLTMRHNGQLRFVHQDPVTKSERVTDYYGNVVSTVDMDPWGGETNRSVNQSVMSRRYTTYERDGNGGDEAQMRRYQSRWRRFSQPDAYQGSYNSGDPQSLNRYSYVQNDPVNYTDPSGRCLVIGYGVDGQTSYYDFVLCAGDRWRPPLDLPAPDTGGAAGAEPQQPTGQGQNHCEIMANVAQNLVNSLRSKYGNRLDSAGVLRAFDVKFSHWYTGAWMGSSNDLIKGIEYGLQTSAHTGSKPPELQKDHPELFGPGGFPDKFQDKDRTLDQTHHFAAYLSAGINSRSVIAALHAADDRFGGNFGDVNLGKAAFALGSYLRNNPGKIDEIGALIRSYICGGQTPPYPVPK